MMKLHILKGHDAGRVIEIKPDGFTIGRISENDLVLNEEGVSRHHCRIRKTGDSWTIEDLESVNGVRVNGERIKTSTPLEEGDEIAILGNLLLFTAEDAPATTPGGAPPLQRGKTVPAWARENTEIDAPFETGTPAASIPWGRLALLALVIALIAAIGWFVFSGNDKKGKAESEEKQKATATATAPELSDSELAKLIAEEEKTNTPTVPDTAGATGKTPDNAAKLAGGKPAIQTPDEPVPASARIVNAAAGTERENADRMVSEVVLIDSKPAGALTLIDNKECGHTPTIVRGLSRGRHMVLLKLDGYEDFTRQIHVPDMLPTHPYVLRQKAGTLMVTSTPSGAAIWHGTQLLGITPALITWLPPGTYELRLAAPGCKPAKTSVEVSELRGEKIAVKLHSLLGSLELQTEPPGCTIFVDELRKGRTAAAAENARISVPFRLDGLPAGEHLVRVEHPCGAFRAGRVRIAPGEMTRQKVKLWIPDCKLILDDGTTCIGMMIEINKQGDVVLEEKPKQYKRYLKPRIAEVEMLKPEQIEEIFARLRGIRKHEPTARDVPETKKSEKKDRERRREKGKSKTTAAEAPAHDNDVWGDDAGEKKHDQDNEESLRFNSKELHAFLRNSSNTEISRRIRGKKIIITAVPTSMGREGLKGFISFGRRVRCVMSKKDYEESTGAIRAAVAAHSPLTIRGTGVGVRGDLLLLRNAAVVGKEKK